jgi:hypothetical protein
LIAEWHMDDKCCIKWHKSLDYNVSKKGPYIFSLLNITKYRLMFFLFHIWQWTKFVFGFNLYLCVRSIDFVSFYNISIGYWNCSDCVILELFRLCDIVSIGYWNCSDCVILFLLELFRLCDIVSIGYWNCSDCVILFLLDIGTVQTVWYCFCFPFYIYHYQWCLFPCTLRTIFSLVQEVISFKPRMSQIYNTVHCRTVESILQKTHVLLCVM